MSTSKKRTKSAARKAPQGRKPQGRAQAAPRRAAATPTRGRQSNRTRYIALAVVIAFGLAILVATLGGSGSKTSTTTDALVPKYGRAAAPASLVQSVTSVPASVHNQIGLGSGKLPQPVSDVALGTKPGVLFVGAEFCPFCAAERWALVNALSRFGTFSNLQVTHSSSTDSFPNTETFSFYGSTFASPYLTFSPVEVQTNQPSNGSYKLLQTPNQQQGELWQKYTQQGYPFIYFNGKFVTTAAFDPGVLADKTHTQIAAALHDPNSAIAKAAIGTANGFTAAICTLTNNTPTSACSGSMIAQLQSQLHS